MFFRIHFLSDVIESLMSKEKLVLKLYSVQKNQNLSYKSGWWSQYISLILPQNKSLLILPQNKSPLILPQSKTSENMILPVRMQTLNGKKKKKKKM